MQAWWSHGFSAPQLQDGPSGPLPMILQRDLGEETGPAQDHTRHRTRAQSHAPGSCPSERSLLCAKRCFPLGRGLQRKFNLRKADNFSFSCKMERLRRWFLTLAAHWNHLASFWKSQSRGPIKLESGDRTQATIFFKNPRWSEWAANVGNHRTKRISFLSRHLISAPLTRMAKQIPTLWLSSAKWKSKTGTNTSPNNWTQYLEGQWPSGSWRAVLCVCASAVFLWGAVCRHVCGSECGRKLRADLCLW